MGLFHDFGDAGGDVGVSVGYIGAFADILGDIVEFDRCVGILFSIQADAFEFVEENRLFAPLFQEFPIEIRVLLLFFRLSEQGGQHRDAIHLGMIDTGDFGQRR